MSLAPSRSASPMSDIRKALPRRNVRQALPAGVLGPVSGRWYCSRAAARARRRPARPDMPAVEHLQFGGHPRNPACGSIAADIRTLTPNRNKTVFARLGSAQKLDDLRGDRVRQFHNPNVLQRTKPASTGKDAFQQTAPPRQCHASHKQKTHIARRAEKRRRWENIIATSPAPKLAGERTFRRICRATDASPPKLRREPTAGPYSGPCRAAPHQPCTRHDAETPTPSTASHMTATRRSRKSSYASGAGTSNSR